MKKKRFVLALALALMLVVALGVPVFAWDVEDPCVADNEDFWNVNGWDGGEQQLGPIGKGCMGAQHPDWTDKDGVWNVAVPTGYNLYRDDVTNKGNLDKVTLRTDTPGEILIDDTYLTERVDNKHWKNCPLGKRPVDSPDCIHFTKLTYENPDTWYWDTAPRGYDFPPAPAQGYGIPDMDFFKLMLPGGSTHIRYCGKSLMGDVDFSDGVWRIQMPKTTVLSNSDGSKPSYLKVDENGRIISHINFMNGEPIITKI